MNDIFNVWKIIKIFMFLKNLLKSWWVC